MSESQVSQAEASAVTPPSVVAGLGYPNGRAEVSVEPTGWMQSKIAVDGSAVAAFDVTTIQATGQAK